MSATVAILSLHPLTRKSIERRGTPPACGCRGMADPALVYLCDYHEGFDDGIELYRNDEPPPQERNT